jgi:hypothetical protein
MKTNSSFTPLQIKKPLRKPENDLYISDKIYIDTISDNNRVLSKKFIKNGELLIAEYPKINLFGEKVEDRDLSFIKKLILSDENKLFPREISQFKRTKMTKKVFDKINMLSKFNLTDKNFFERYDDFTIEYFYEKHLFNSFEGHDYGPLYLPFIAKVNHSCEPNTKFIFNRDEGLMSLISIKDIQINTEITNSYLSNKNINSHTNYLIEHYGFDCNCGSLNLKHKMMK